MARYRRITLPAPATTDAHALDAVRARRAGLRSAMSGLEHALAEPAPGREVEWAAGVRDALDAVHEVWVRHVVDTEAPGAFLDELVAQEPRLANQAKKMREEHGEILGVLLRAEDDLSGVPVDIDADVIRATLTELLGALVRHRQRGADLVYEAYDVDVGGGG